MSARTLLVLVATVILAVSTQAFYDSFGSDDLAASGWVQSKATKPGASEDIASYNGRWVVKDGRLRMDQASRHYGLSRKLEPAFSFKDDKPLVVQYEVKYDQNVECGGSYVKLLSQSDDLDLEQLTDKTPYTILFGPDKCGTESHLRFIYRHQSPVTGEYREVHANAIPQLNQLLFSDRKTHLVKLVVRPDQTFSIYLDGKMLSEGTLYSSDDFDPALQPAAEIDDPEDKKPEDWVDNEMMDDPEDEKPEDWDEEAPEYIPDEAATKPEKWDEDAPEYIHDPEAEKPEDWDDDEDGDWEAPLIRNPQCDAGCGPWSRPVIRNPDYKGKWSPRQIPNPAYKGKWAPRRIPNPEHFKEEEPFQKLDGIGALAFELWTVTGGVSFGNVYIGSDEAKALELQNTQWKPVRDEEDASDPSNSFVTTVTNLANDFINQANDKPYLYVVATVVLAVAIAAVVNMLGTGRSTAAAAPAAQASEEITNEGDEANGEDGEDDEAEANDDEADGTTDQNERDAEEDETGNDKDDDEDDD